MDTKFLNKLNNEKSFTYLVSRLLLIVLSIMLIAGAALVTCEKPITFRSYFYDSENIKTEAIRYAKNLQRYYIYFRNFDPTVAERKISEIDAYLQKSEGIVSDSSYGGVYDTQDSDGQGITSEDELKSKSLYNQVSKPEELYAFTSADLSSLTTDEITRRELSLSEALQNYYSVKNYLDTTEHFHYYLYTANQGRLVATNAGNFNDENVYDSISITDRLFADVNFNDEPLSESFINNGFECTLSIPVDTSSYFIKNEVSQLRRVIKINRVTASPITPLLMIVSGMLIFAYMMYSHRELVQRVNSFIYRRFKRLPLIFKLLMLLGIILFYISNYEKTYTLSILLAEGNWDNAFMLLLAAFAAVTVVILILENIYNIFRRPSLLQEEADINFVLVSLRNFRFALRTQSYFLIFIYISVALIFVLSCVFMFFNLPAAFESLENMIIYLVLCFPVFITAMVIKLINAHIKLCWYIKEMSLGNIEIIPKQEGLFVEPLNNLNNINDGVKRTMNEAIKNERLKSELITNVSHDLKTPLTSIISYVNLLKELKIDNKAADEYIDVIENKATRLKILIDDLFEASKLSSGQMKLDRNPSDIVSLLKQTMGELSYKIEESGIEFKTDLPESPVILNIDGQKMWRVFDNMLNNIIKYSPGGSRAYIDISDKSDRTVITFKNVSSYPLDFDTGELFERFKRGDAARATEGSGLGLSIAKSIVDLHGGNMSIVTDGDLFKVIIVLYKNK